MDELTMRAMLGDEEAAREITERGELLPCRFAEKRKEFVSEDSFNLFEDVVKETLVVFCLRCGKDSRICLTQEEANADWNRRAKVVTFCKDCKYHTMHTHEGIVFHECYAHYDKQFGLGYVRGVDPNDFCSDGEPKEEQ